MSTTKVTTQKVIAVLKKAGLKIELKRSRSRFSSGYSVNGYYVDHPMIEIDYNGEDARRSGSYTANKIEKLTSAASVLLDGGITVLMSSKIPNGKLDSEQSGRYGEYKLYIRKDGAPQTNAQYAHWNVDEITHYFSEQVVKELADEAAERALKDAKKSAAEQAQAECMSRCLLLNPMIAIDHDYLPGLFTAHVTLLDGRMAVLTVAYITKAEYDWQATAATKAEQMYNVFEIDLTYVTPGRYMVGTWERGTSNFTTDKDQNVLDAIRYWITRQ